MKIYHYNSTTLEYVGEGLADKDPLDSNNWLVPANATTTEPLAPQENKTINFINNEWVYIDIPVIEDTSKQKQELTYAEKRAEEYPPMTDYLDGIVKGDQAQIQAYIDACNAVKNKYPKGQV